MTTRQDRAVQRAAASRLSRRSLVGGVVAGAAAGWLTRGGLAQPEATPAVAPEGEVRVYPPADTWTASPGTEISFRGLTAAELGAVEVTGSISGGLSGVLAPHGDGRGVSYLPDFGFAPGEVVEVRAAGLPDGAVHRFGVARPVAAAVPQEERETAAPEHEPMAFRSRPDLRPPVIEITTPAEDTAPGHVFVGAKVTDGQNGALMLDNEGQPVWFGLPVVPTSMIYDVKVQRYRGAPVLTWMEGATPGGYGTGHFVIADETYTRVASVQVGNGFPGGDLHEFEITPRDTALVIIYSSIEWDLTPVGGPKHGAVVDGVVQEVEIETGRVLFEWHSLDHITVDETRIAYAGLDNNDRPFDYLHMNSIEEDPDGNLVISARHTFAIYKIDRASGEVAWRLNGEQSDFAMGEGTPFAWQHDARVHPDGTLTLFDNAESNQDLADERASRGMVLALDEAAMTATLVREYIHPTEILSTSQANMQVLPNGNVFIGWGSAPVFSEFSAEGDLLFNGRFPTSGTSYRAYRYEWVGRPAEPPAVAVEAGASGGMTVYVSWNGATEVARWRVLGGDAPDALDPLVEAARSGFETAIPVESAARHVAVEAIDAAGEVLGRSEIVSAGR